MPNPSTAVRNIELSLQTVIMSLIDTQHGFQKLGESLKNEILKTYFLEESLKRAEFRGQLETVLHQEGMHDISEAGSVTGAILSFWTNLQAKMHESDHALLITAEQAEVDTIQAYMEAQDRILPLPIRQLLTSQAAHVETSLDYVRAARDGSKKLS